ncbi:hypothetical protein L5515_015342 [Caenorhabditis briggsae]|uniref:Uncharacterized protein n=1 Tax=Caenorhabditis briggsae TaxID=6238 RepID=A0AAE9EEP1_CAEBR|nr:hypothetical protein L5515_015342 [Caenorhabditis briggsae]
MPQHQSTRYQFKIEMWVLKAPLFILLIDGIKSTKDSRFALDEYYQEASEIYKKANKIHLENELATGKIGALDVSERILNKKIDASLLEEYLEMKISGGLKEQNEMLELFEKAKESETSEQLKDDVENGFNMMDGFSDLEKKISEINIYGVYDYFRRLKKRFNQNFYASEYQSELFTRIYHTYSKILESVSSFQDDTLSDADKRIVWKNIELLREINITSHELQDGLEQHGFNNDLQGFASVERTRDVTEKLNAMMDEVKNFKKGIDSKLLKVEKEMETLEALREGNVNATKRLEKLAETTDNLLTLIERRYPNPAQVDRDLLSLFREFLNEHACCLNFRDDYTFYGWIIEASIRLKELNLDNAREVFDGIFEKLDEPKQFLKCYSNLETTASDMKELLVLPGKVWNFDPKVLESTVEVVGMFKEAYKMIEEIKEWKVATNPEIENFPLDGEDVKAVSDGTNVLETIRNVQNGLEMMKTVDIENLGIKDSWDLLDSSLSQFFEILSRQKIWNSSNVSFPTNLPIDTIKTFIEDEYQENQRNDILNFLKEIQILKTDFHEYPNKLEKMNEAMEKMKRWEDEKMNPVKTMVDCFEMECNASLKLLKASN